MSTLRQAIQLVNGGRVEKGVAVLRDLVNANQHDVYAWLWLAEFSPDHDEACNAARQVLRLRSTNQRAYDILLNMGEAPVWQEYAANPAGWFGKRKRAMPVPQDGPWTPGLVLLLSLMFAVTVLFIIIGVAVL